MCVYMCAHVCMPVRVCACGVGAVDKALRCRQRPLWQRSLWMPDTAPGTQGLGLASLLQPHCVQPRRVL